VNALRISFSRLNLTVVCVFIRVVPGAFTIDSSTPTLTGNLNEHRYKECLLLFKYIHNILINITGVNT
jgi:hypothetical protein